MKHPDYPRVTDWADHTGTIRWRWRKGSVTKYLPGQPHTAEFDTAYQALEGGAPLPEKKKAAPPARILAMPGAASPGSFTAAYRELKTTQKWKALSESSHKLYMGEIERFLHRPVAEGGTACWGDMPISDLRYVHVQALMDDETVKVHMRHLMLISVRKLIRIGLRKQWIEADPSFSVELPAPTGTRGDQPWTDADHEQFCARHKVGTPARTCYGLARWMGNRRGDIFKLKWTDIATVRIRNRAGEMVVRDGFWVEHEKGKKRRMVRGQPPKKIFQPVSPMLAAILAPLDRTTETILVKRDGKPYANKVSLTMMMSVFWAPQAGLSKGHTIHGLRHALGGTMADAGVGTKGRMQVLGHENIKHAQTYSQSADQILAAIEAIDAVTEFVGRDDGKGKLARIRKVG